jgi:hypothetical protein
MPLNMIREKLVNKKDAIGSGVFFVCRRFTGASAKMNQ